jgi:hypothetical protein
MLSKKLDKLPPQIKQEVLDYIEFLVKKYKQPRKRKTWKFGWEGCLSRLKKRYTSVELQHKASEWR